jgi:hypothetical protein
MRKMEGIIRNFPGEETRVGIQTGEGADAAIQVGGEDNGDPPIELT